MGSLFIKNDDGSYTYLGDSGPVRVCYSSAVVSQLDLPDAVDKWPEIIIDDVLDADIIE